VGLAATLAPSAAARVASEPIDDDGDDDDDDDDDDEDDDDGLAEARSVTVATVATGILPPLSALAREK